MNDFLILICAFLIFFFVISWSIDLGNQLRGSIKRNRTKKSLINSREYEHNRKISFKSKGRIRKILKRKRK